MKQVLHASRLPVFLGVLVALSLPPTEARAGSGVNTFQLQQMEERYQGLAAQVSDLQIVQAALQQSVRELTEEARLLRAELSRRTADNASRQEFTQFAEQLDALDRQRRKDRKDIMARVDEIRTLLNKPVPTPPPATREPSKPRSEKGYYYTIQGRDTLSAIVEAYRSGGVEGLTVDDIVEANPGLEPRTLTIGKEIFIPHPDL